MNSRTISHDTQEVELDDITPYNIFDTKIYKISLTLTSQDTSPLLNKVTRAPSDILIGQTRFANSSHGLPKYLMIHSPFCSINVTEMRKCKTDKGKSYEAIYLFNCLNINVTHD